MHIAGLLILDPCLLVVIPDLVLEPVPDLGQILFTRLEISEQSVDRPKVVEVQILPSSDWLFAFFFDLWLSSRS